MDKYKENPNIEFKVLSQLELRCGKCAHNWVVGHSGAVDLGLVVKILKANRRCPSCGSKEIDNLF